ncbi:NAD(P)H-dependent glycerol-3-phosphate dehydrogenase, partial [Mycobacterium tuberculosis]
MVLRAPLRAPPAFPAAAPCAAVVVLGVPSPGFRGVLVALRPALRPWVPVVSLVPGLAPGPPLRLSPLLAA